MRILYVFMLLAPSFSWANWTVTPHAGDNQTAAPGQSVAISPSVIVTDSSDDPTPGLDVQFSIAAGGGLISGASTTTNEEGIATVGSWVLGTLPGEKLLEASVEGADESVIFRAVAEAENEFSITLEPVDETIVAGLPFAIDLVVHNTGDYPANGTQISMEFDPIIVPESISWTCQASAGAACSEEGSEELEDMADIPFLSNVTYTITAAVPIQLLNGSATLAASLVPPVGLLLPDGENGETALTLEIEPNPFPIFEDRFEGDATKAESP